jgi:hypothetical protein
VAQGDGALADITQALVGGKCLLLEDAQGATELSVNVEDYSYLAQVVARERTSPRRSKTGVAAAVPFHISAEDRRARLRLE